MEKGGGRADLWASHFGDLLIAFFGPRSLIDFGMHFGRPLAHFWRPFGSLLAPFGSLWRPFGSLLAPVGSLLAPAGSLLAPFGSLLVSLGSLLVSFLSLLLTQGFVFSLWLYSALVFLTFLNFPCMYSVKSDS